jgi:hypothetical protein
VPSLINQSYVELAKYVLGPGERVLLTARQRRVGPGGALVAPSVVLATTKRIIIINRLSKIRTSTEIINYNAIAFVKMNRGIISSTVVIGTRGSGGGAGSDFGKTEEINGLNANAAIELVKHINDVLDRMAEDQRNAGGGGGGRRSIVSDQPAGPNPNYLVCKYCGTQNPAGSKFCINCGRQLQQLRTA